MTLVVTDASKQGIIMVGDSAVTIPTSTGKTVVDGCKKVQYAHGANVGFTMWGVAHVGQIRSDRWLEKFIGEFDSTDETVDTFAAELARRLNAAFAAGPSPGHRGFHVAGFVDYDGTKVPRVYHVRPDKADGYKVVRAYVDYPDGSGDFTYERIRSGKHYVLRNGYHPLYTSMMEAASKIADAWRVIPNFNWPSDSLRDQSAFLALQVKFVAQALVEAEKLPAVNTDVSVLAFNPRWVEIQTQRDIENESLTPFAAANSWTL